MGLPYADSFSGYATAQIPLKLTGGITGGTEIVIEAGGRNGNQCLSIADAGSVDFILKVPTTGIITTFAILTNSPPAGTNVNIAEFYLSTNVGGTPVAVASVSLNNMGGFTGFAGHSTASSANSIWFQNSYFGIGCSVSTSVVSNVATTTLIVYLAGVQILTVTGTQTVPVGTPTAITDFSFRWQQGGFFILFSDFTITDTTDGVFPTTFIGDVFVTPNFADNNGTQTDWTPLSGSNFSNINEHPPDGDTSYVKSHTAGNIDVYHFPAATGFLPAGSQIFGVQHNVMARKDNSGSRSIAPTCFVNADSSFHLGDTVSIGDTYDYYYKCWSVNPKTGLQWALADTCGSGSQFGQKLIS